MNRPFLAVIVLFLTCASIFGQEPQLTIVKLGAAVYPPIARAARVSGDVVLNVTLTPDGSAEAVTIESGPPMLRSAALSSVRQSQFQAAPRNHTGGYRLVYRFVLAQTTECEHDDSYPRVKHAMNAVTITEQNVPICDPAAVIEKVRSVRCLYLWKCSSKIQ